MLDANLAPVVSSALAVPTPLSAPASSLPRDERCALRGVTKSFGDTPILKGIDFDVLPSQGTYFANVDFRPLWNEGTDVDFAMKLVREARVGSIPVSAFYPENPPTHLVRFCFCKRDAVLDEAIARLRAFAGKNG